MPTYVIYARKSTESDDRQALSIPSQIATLLEFAHQTKIEIDGVFQESQSARQPGRPKFNRLLEQVRKQSGLGILCWRLDRLARNLHDVAVLIQLMQDGAIREIRTPQAIYGNSSMDLFISGLDFLIAKKYVDDLSDNVRRGLGTKLQQGWRPGRPPLGYLNDTRSKTIVIDPNRFRIVRRMWETMLAGKVRPRRIVTMAASQWGLTGVPSRRIPNRTLSISNIYLMFRNPFYYGMIRYGGEYYPGSHTPMVSKAEFDRVQELMQNRGNPKPKRYSFTYRGLLNCGECGAAVTAEHKTNHSGYHYIYYHCTRRKAGVRCRQRSIEEKRLEVQLRSYLSTLAIPRSQYEEAQGCGLPEQELEELYYRFSARRHFQTGSPTEKRNILNRLNAAFTLVDSQARITPRPGRLLK